MHNKGVCRTVALSFTLKKYLKPIQEFYFIWLKNDIIAMAG
jgi:hypothetical protein